MANSLFCGGPFPFDCRDQGFEDMAAGDYRARLLGDVRLLLEPHPGLSLCPGVSYIGPFYYETEDMTDRDIVRREYDMIEACTDALFLLDDGLCPGTVGEMVLAASMGKRVHIFYAVHEEETESGLRSPCWHPILLSGLVGGDRIHVIPCRDYEEAAAGIPAYIRSLFVTEGPGPDTE